MKKFALFVFCMAVMSACPAQGAVVFEENFESGGEPFGFAWKWTKGAAWNEGSLVTENGNRIWREIFKPGSTDTYFGFTTSMKGTGSGNAIYFKFRVRYGDALHPYTWATARRSHELKFPDLCPGGPNGDRTCRVICEHRGDRDGKHGSFRVWTRLAVKNGDTYHHILPVQLVSNAWYTIQVGLVDNGDSGDIVKIWCNNEIESAPDYSYVSKGNLFNSAQWWQCTTEWAYRNHAVAADQYFYYDDIRIGTAFIPGPGKK